MTPKRRVQKKDSGPSYLHQMKDVVSASLDERIASGNKLLSRIDTLKRTQLAAWDVEYELWNRNNLEYLCEAFSSEDEANKYDCYGIRKIRHYYPSKPLHIELEERKSNLKARIEQLMNLVAKLEQYRQANELDTE